jgi:hypothetical protein
MQIIILEDLIIAIEAGPIKCPSDWVKEFRAKRTDVSLNRYERVNNIFRTLYEYEDCPRVGIVFDRDEDHIILYTDRILMDPQTIARIRESFGLPDESTVVEGDFHYRSKGTPSALA